jgi:short-subunit dehydrogenase
MTHVAITGASSGIGEALVKEYVRAGAAVTMVARRRSLMESLARELGGRTRIVEADLSCPDRALDWIAPAEAELGPIEILINNAGQQIVEPTAEVDPARARRLLDLDLVVPLAITRQILPGMLARGRGTIVDISSVAALGPTPGMTHYNAAKAGLAAASESLRGELRRTGVHVLTVYPGPVETAMGRAGYAAYPPSPLVARLPKGTPEELARRVRLAVEDRAPRLVYPAFYGAMRFIPTVARFFLDRFTPAPYSRLTPAEPRALPSDSERTAH